VFDCYVYFNIGDSRIIKKTIWETKRN